MKTFAACLILGLAVAGSGRAASPDPAPFAAVLAARARNGGFDYRGATGQDRKRLAAYLANLGDARPSAMTPDEKKAFYVNAYNAMAIGIVLDRYPIKSIMDVDGAFKKIERRIGGETLSLDGIENKLRSQDDPGSTSPSCASPSPARRSPPAPIRPRGSRRPSTGRAALSWTTRSGTRSTALTERSRCPGSSTGTARSSSATRGAFRNTSRGTSPTGRRPPGSRRGPKSRSFSSTTGR